LTTTLAAAAAVTALLAEVGVARALEAAAALVVAVAVAEGAALAVVEVCWRRILKVLLKEAMKKGVAPVKKGGQ
jgi:hypothetical protein